MFKHLKLSSPGKIILCGEHSVVYGKKALACSINLRTYLNAEYLSTNQIFQLNLNDIKNVIKITEDDFKKCQALTFNDLDNIMEFIEKNSSNDKHNDSIKFLIIALNNNLKWSNLSSLNINIDSEIPLSSGLGSSASYSVCLSTLFLILSDKITTNFKSNKDELELINKYSFYLEKLFHGKPSGIDNSVSTFGNFLVFEKGMIVEKFESNTQLNVLITNSCVPKQTIEQVKKVRNLYEKHQTILDHLMDTINTLVEKFIDLLKNSQNSIDQLNDLITLNQGLLYSIQVSNKELNEIINLSLKYGYHSKLTGAGGGGCCITLLSKSNASLNENLVLNLIKDLKENKYLPFRTKLGCEGVLLEQIII